MSEAPDQKLFTPGPAERAAADAAYSVMLDNLLSGQLHPTESQPESEASVARRFNLGSRMPVRVALAALAAEGLITQRARHGFWVLDYNGHQLQEVCKMRANAEVMVASGLAARLADHPHEYAHIPGAIEQLLNALAAHAGALSGGTRDQRRAAQLEFDKLDNDFHVFIANTAGYDIAARHISQWRNQLRLYRVQHGVEPKRKNGQAVCNEHQIMWETIRAAAASSNESDWQLIEDNVIAHIHNALQRSGVEKQPRLVRLPGAQPPAPLPPPVGTRAPGLTSSRR
jgi:DNA-binding GntR family transcriptional regulator